MLIVEQVVRLVGSELQYLPQSHVSQATYDASGLFRSADRFNGEDLVQGRVGATQLQFPKSCRIQDTQLQRGNELAHHFSRCAFRRRFQQALPRRHIREAR
jgi:hypothetical protein